MAISKNMLNAKLREKYISLISDFLSSKDEQVLRTASNTLALPCLDENGNEEFMVITFKIPKGSRDGSVYDGFTEAEAYADKLLADKLKNEEKAKQKARKIERDKKMRAEKQKIFQK